MKTCLIIDDSSVVRKVARRIVEDIGFECLEADDGITALKMCEKAMPDSILIDWNMPGMSGIEFLEKLRPMPGGDKPKVIFCSTENERVFIQRAMDAGANEYIMKPFDTDILVVKFAQTGLI